MKTIIYIASDVRSGSTMLDNLLSNHPQAESVGELSQLTSYLNKGDGGASENWSCTCGESLEACPVWTRVAGLYEQQYERPLRDVQTRAPQKRSSRLFRAAVLLAALVPINTMRRWLVRRDCRRDSLENMGQELYRILDAFARTTGTEILVDSSKRVDHLYALIAAKPSDVDLKLIHIIRDGRAVLYSKKKRVKELERFGHRPFRLIPSICAWCYDNFRILDAMSHLDPQDAMTIRYEDLCTDREGTLRQICERLKLEFDGGMLHLSSENKHNVGGSPHRFSWSTGTQIRLDERWKQELPRWQRMVYCVTTGLVHRRLGY